MVRRARCSTGGLSGGMIGTAQPLVEGRPADNRISCVPSQNSRPACRQSYPAAEPLSSLLQTVVGEHRRTMSTRISPVVPTRSLEGLSQPMELFIHTVASARSIVVSIPSFKLLQPRRTHSLRRPVYTAPLRGAGRSTAVRTVRLAVYGGGRFLFPKCGRRERPISARRGRPRIRPLFLALWRATGCRSLPCW